MATINFRERIVMRAIYEAMQGRDSALLKIDEIYSKINPRKYIKFLKKETNYEEAEVGKFFVKDKPIKKEDIKDILYVLEYAQYFNLTTAKDSDQEVFVIDMLDKGKNFLRDEKDKRKSIYLIIARTVALAVLSFLVSMILKAWLS
ncbi:MAG TPA: hypothetical protein VIL26_03905 [Clostridia bacterium]